MLYGLSVTSDHRFSYSWYTCVYISFLLVASVRSNESGAFSQHDTNSDCPAKFGFPNGRSVIYTPFSQSVTLSSFYNIIDSPGDYQILLICSDPPANCNLLLEVACGLNPNSGFYNCSTPFLRSFEQAGNCFDVVANTYQQIGDTFLDSSGTEVSTVNTMGFSYSSTTYPLSGYDFNLSVCLSTFCENIQGDLVGLGTYYLSSAESDCPCDDFLCCQPASRKRSLLALCTLTDTQFLCSTSDNCTVLLVNGTTLNTTSCKAKYSFADVQFVCTASGCVSSPIYTTPATLTQLSPVAFWSLLAVSIVLFIALGGLAYWICCKSYLANNLM